MTNKVMPLDPANINTDRNALAQEFVQFAIESGVLRFGEFKTKAGRLSPYFFNAGLFNDGASLSRLSGFYARRILAAGHVNGPREPVPREVVGIT